MKHKDDKMICNEKLPFGGNVQTENRYIEFAVSRKFEYGLTSVWE